MKEDYYNFNTDKNHFLKETRNISFEEAIAIIQNGGLLDVVNHPNQQKYPNQQMYLIDIDGYVYIIPFIRENKNCVFLKTIFRSRKMTKQYLQENNEEHLK